jgi:disulfide bond formation protein DsbB
VTAAGVRGAFVAIALVSFGAVGIALVTQHVYDMQPCPWCVLQRLVFVAIGLVALLAAASTVPLLQRISATVVALLAASGVAAALWQHFVAAASASCNLTFADRFMNATGLAGALPEVFAAYASCADAKVNLFGVPYEFYSLALFIGLGIAAVRQVGRLRTVRGRG